MIKKFLLIIIISFLPLFIGGISCDDCPESEDRFKVTSLIWGEWEASYSENARPQLKFSEINNGSVRYNKFAIVNSVEKETYYSLSERLNQIFTTNTLLACQRPPPRTDEKLNDIKIFSNRDYNLDYLYNSNLADLFDVIISSWTTGESDVKYNLVDYLKSNPFVPNSMTLILREPPSSTNEFEFRVEYYLDGIDHDYFDHLTKRIIIRTE
ncbi:MAG: hypothetical protein ISR82_01810 [Candidatus Marinimicrobia bacterium]|nr:hypothetical protein [Candidatus Neomarinimicrobiota bacterium]MBL7009941.1 hypothetical protein [Candidatus Neomarinimicrobiota bacterium]MBL7029760.1 hypothetical protein [Candidatus Neomarinimicrobiota bacterium]